MPIKLKEHFGYQLDEDINSYNLSHRNYLIDLIDQHKVLLWPKQNLTAHELVRFSEILGPCWTNDNQEYLGGNGEARAYHPETNKITVVGNKKGVLGSSKVGWHSDIVHKPIDSPGGTNPFRILYAHQLPSDTETVTKWADCEYAYQCLSTEQQELANSLKIICSASEHYSTAWTENVMPFVMKNLRTGKPILKLETIFFKQFQNLDEVASFHLMKKFIGTGIPAENIYRHVWQTGDLIISNNLNTIHEREKFQTSQERILWRTTFQIDEFFVQLDS